jgi:uncharacterized protein (TIGR00251 family)
MATLHVHVVPNAKNNGVAGTLGDAIKIRLRAPAIEGKANAALVGFLSERLKISGRQIVLLRGQKSRDKVLRIDGLGAEEILRRIMIRTDAER